MQNHLATTGAHAVDLDSGRCDRHNNNRVDIQFSACQRNALRMISGAGGDYAPLSSLCSESGHLVVSTPKFEAVDWLHIFALQQHLIVQAARQGMCDVYRAFYRNVLDTRSEDLLDVLFNDSIHNSVRKQWAFCPTGVLVRYTLAASGYRTAV